MFADRMAQDFYPRIGIDPQSSTQPATAIAPELNREVA